MSSAARPDAGRSERRQITALFVDVCGFTALSERLDPELVTEVLNRLFRRVDEVVALHGGYLDKFIGDAALALFGAPTAHEDDPERAVSTALELFRRLPELERELEHELGLALPVRLHAGVASGEVVAGVLGAGEAARYSALGDAVNVAARLLGEAGPGEVLVDPQTAARLRGRVRLEPRGALQLRGRAQPVLAHRALGLEGELPRGWGPLVGREEELAALAPALAAVRAGRGAVVSVVGGPGLGKTRLMRDALNAWPWPRHIGRSASYTRELPYHPWAEVVRSLLAQPGVSARLEALDQERPGPLPRREALALLLGGSAGEALPPPQRRAAALEALQDLLRAAPQPCVVGLDDLQWADEPSVELLAALLPLLAEHAVLWVILRRPGGTSNAEEHLYATALLYDFPALRIQLRALAEPHARALLRGLVGAALPAEVEDALVARAAGVPLFLEELVRQLEHSGALTPVAGGWRLDPAQAARAQQALPPTLHALLAARVDRLPAGPRARLELGAVLGPVFEPALVDQALGADVQAWAALLGAELFSGLPDGRLRFTQPTLQEVVYSSLLSPQRRALHLRAAAALEQGPRLEGAHLHALAWHLERGDAPQRAAAAWVRAARELAMLGTYREELVLLQRVLALDPAQADALGLRLARLYGRLGRLGDAVATLEALIPRLEAAGQVGEAARAWSERAYLAYVSGDGEHLLPLAERAVALAEQSGELLARAEAWRRLGIAHEYLGEHAAAERAYSRVLALAEGAEDPRLLDLVSGVHNSLGEMARARGAYATALRCYERSQAVRRRAWPLAPNLSSLLNGGGALCGLGRWDEAIATEQEALAEIQRGGFRALAPECLSLLAVALAGAGRLDEALQAADRAWDEARAQGQLEMSGLSERVRGLIWRERGAVDRAATHLLASLDALVAARKALEEALTRRALEALHGPRPAEGWVALALAPRVEEG